jgi:DNA topoisomerase-1
MVVNDFLMKYFPSVLDYHFTASVEKEFDSIADGELNWTNAIDSFYKVFHPIVEKTAAEKTEHKVGERALGDDPKTGLPVFVKIGRYGPVAQLGIAKPEEKNAKPEDKSVAKPQFASLMKGQSIETITLEQALKLFELPRTIGEYEDKTIVAGVGRFGPFLRHDTKFTSIPSHLTPQSITFDESIALILEKRLKEEQRHLKVFEEAPDLEVLNGRYGPYIVYKKQNYKIPPTVKEPRSLTLEEVMKIIHDVDSKPAAKKRTSKKK